MWATARYDLHVAEDEVWWLTPRQFVALIERHRKNERRMDLRFGVVASVIANVNRDPKRRPAPYAATDFFPDPEDELPKLTLQALRAEFEAAGVEVISRNEEPDG